MGRSDDEVQPERESPNGQGKPTADPAQQDDKKGSDNHQGEDKK